MKTTKTKTVEVFPQPSDDFFTRIWDESWTYIKTVVDVVHEPVLILDKDLRVMVANLPFYKTFQVEPKDTEGRVVYELGNRQWDIPPLQKLLEDILPQNTFFKGFEVSHDFPQIGKKVMILNARRIYGKGFGSEALFPIILLAMEDITEMVGVAEMLARHSNQFEAKLSERTAKLETHIKKLEQEINKLQENS